VVLGNERDLTYHGGIQAVSEPEASAYGGRC